MCLQFSTTHQFLKCVQLFFISYAWMNRQAILSLYIDSAVFQSYKQGWEKDIHLQGEYFDQYINTLQQLGNKIFLGASNPCDSLLCTLQWSVHYLLTSAYMTAGQHMDYLHPKDILFHYQLPKNYIIYSGTCHTALYTDVSILLIMNIQF